VGRKTQQNKNVTWMTLVFLERNSRRLSATLRRCNGKLDRWWVGLADQRGFPWPQTQN
jgi:hypothetical protein